MDIELNILEKWINGSDNIVFITGQDFSAEAASPTTGPWTKTTWPSTNIPLTRSSA